MSISEKKLSSAITLGESLFICIQLDVSSFTQLNSSVYATAVMKRLVYNLACTSSKCQIEEQFQQYECARM